MKSASERAGLPFTDASLEADVAQLERYDDIVAVWDRIMVARREYNAFVSYLGKLGMLQVDVYGPIEATA
jgi:hypothetical protein